jgi:predicted RecA/RadA family phage recombinase
MATKRKFFTSGVLRVTVPSATKSNDPITYGDMAGVALTDYASSDAKATVAFTGVYTLSVQGVNAAGNVAVAAGDALYVSAAGVISRNATGVFFGYAMGAVSSGATTAIDVRLADGGPGADEALAGVFISAETTGTGSSQNVAHGLGRTPTKVLVVPTEFASNLNVDVAEGTHTSTNVVLTVTSGAKFKVLAY